MGKRLLRDNEGYRVFINYRAAIKFLGLRKLHKSKGDTLEVVYEENGSKKSSWGNVDFNQGTERVTLSLDGKSKDNQPYTLRSELSHFPWRWPFQKRKFIFVDKETREFIVWFKIEYKRKKV